VFSLEVWAVMFIMPHADALDIRIGFVNFQVECRAGQPNLALFFMFVLYYCILEVCFFLSPPDRLRLSVCLVHSLVRPDRCCYHDIS